MDVEFSTDLIGCMGKQDSQTNIDNVASSLLQQVAPEDIVIFTDGSAVEGTKDGGAGAVISIPYRILPYPRLPTKEGGEGRVKSYKSIPGREKTVLKRACGALCSSF